MVMQFNRVTFSLLLLYTIVAITVGFQLIKIVYYRHNLYSFQFGFLLLGFVWALMRSILWGFFRFLAVPTLSLGGVILLDLPVNFQFGTFSLFVMFLAHLVHKASWERITKMHFVIAFSAVNGILLALQIAWIVVQMHADGDDLRLSRVNSLLTASFFLLLSAILAYYGWRLRTVMQTSRIQMQAVIPPRIITVTLVILLLFTSRVAFNVVSALGYVYVDLDSASMIDQLSIVCSYFLWEIVPTSLVLLLFWRIPRTNPRYRSSVFFPPNLASTSRVKDAPTPPYVQPEAYDERQGLLQNSRGSPYSGSAPWGSFGIGKNSPYATTPLPYSQHSITPPMSNSNAAILSGQPSAPNLASQSSQSRNEQ